MGEVERKNNYYVIVKEIYCTFTKMILTTNPTKVRNGDYLVKKMLTSSIDRQEEVRNAIAKDLPQMEWATKNTGHNTL